MGKFYPGDYHDGRDGASYLERYSYQYEYIKNLKFDAVLDVGCARGDWLDFLQAQRPEIELHGVDAFSSCVKNPAIHFYPCALDNAELPDSYFNLVTSWAVLEHVHAPGKYFEIVSKVLKPGGKFVFLVTNSDSIYGKYAYKEDVPRHLYHFNERSLRDYAKKYSLVLDEINYDESFWDGSGRGALYHYFRRVLSISWQELKFKKLSLLARACLRASTVLDRIVFSVKWEAKLKRSGIIVAKMSKVS
jgi:SAM-dependent methyltransferase